MSLPPESVHLNPVARCACPFSIRSLPPRASPQLELVQPLTGMNIYAAIIEKSGRQNFDSARFDGTVAERVCCDLLFIVFAQHCEEPEFRRLRQKLVVAFKPSLLIRQLQVNVEILAGSPIFVEVKYVRIIVTDVKVVVNAAGFGPRTVNKTAQKFDQFCTFFWAGVQSSCEGATWVHNVLWSSFHHVATVQAIWFFNPGTRIELNGEGFAARQFGRTGNQFLERQLP
jgi:hypothetical protein